MKELKLDLKSNKKEKKDEKGIKSIMEKKRKIKMKRKN